MGRFKDGVLLVALCAILAVVVPQVASGARRSVPSAAAQTKARELIRQVYGDEVAAAKDAKSKAKVAKELLASALDLKGDPAGLYVLLNTANNLAVGAGDINGAFQILDALERQFTVDGLSLRVDAFLRVSKKVRVDDQRKAMAKAAVGLVEQLVAIERYEHVEAIVKTGLDSARRVRDTDLINSLKEIKKDNAILVREYAKVKVALETLKSKPADATANTIVGQFRCFVQGKWDEGLTHLALGEDETLKKLGIDELGGADSSAQQVALADGWWELANSKEGLFPSQARERAKFWYDKALAGSSGLIAKRIEKRLEELEEAGRNKATAGRRKRKGPSTLIAVACSRGGVKIIEFKTGKVKKKFQDQTGATPTALAVSPDGKRLAVSTYQSLTLWDVASGKVIAKSGAGDGTSNMYTVAFSRDGTLIATAGSGSTVNIWDGQSAKKLHTFGGNHNPTYSIAFSANGKQLIEASGSNLPIWDIKTGGLTGQLSHFNTVRSVAVSPNGRLIVTGGYNDTVNFLNGKTGQPTASLQGHRGSVASLAFSPDGDRVASGGYDHTVKVWDTNRARGVLNLNGHTDSITSVTYCPSGAYLASSDEDGVVIIWDAKKGARIATVNAGSSYAYAVVFVAGS